MNVSSSKVSDLLRCTLSFYYKNVDKIPERPHWRTSVGSCLHNIVEYLLKPRRRATLARILSDGFVMANHPSIARYCRQFKYHHNLTLWDGTDMEGMLVLTFSTLKPYLEDGQFLSEQRFELKHGDANITGYVDIAAIGANKRILDMKTKKDRFSGDELVNNIQAAIYQMWYYQQYGELVPVDFIMVRHPPTSRTPQKHIQTVKAPTPTQLTGLKYYLSDIYRTINNFGLEDAHASPCADEGFCIRVCPFYRPSSYLSVRKKGSNELVGNFLLDAAPQVQHDEWIETVRFPGCAKFNQVS